MQKQGRLHEPSKKPQVEIYTAIVGNKDPIRTDIKCFTENQGFVRPVMAAKIYKILSHRYIHSDISIWVDGNITLLIPLEQLVEEWLGDSDMALWKHFHRDCIYEEAPAAQGLYEDDSYKKEIQEQIDYYRKQGFPEHAGLAECNVIIRRNNEKVRAFNEDWWQEICRWSSRDQISFPVVLARHKLKVNFIEGNPREHKFFKYVPH